MFSEDGHLVWAAQYRTWGGIKHIWKAENDNDAIRGPYPPVNRGALAIQYETVEAIRALSLRVESGMRSNPLFLRTS